MAKSPKTPSGKAKRQPKKVDDIVEAEIVETADAAADDAAKKVADELPVETLAETPVETVPEDSDYDATVSDTIEISGEMADEVSAAEGDATPDAAEDAPSESEDIVEAPAPAVVQEPQTSGGMFGSVIGGVVAGAIGFVAAMLLFPQGWQAQNQDAIAALQADVSTQSDALATQQEALSGLSEDVAALGEQLGSEASGLRDEIGANADGVDALITRLESLTKSDGTTKLPDDVQILLNTQKEELDALRGQVGELTEAAKAQMDAAAAQQESAEQAEARVKARGAMQNVRLALVSGEPFADALPEIAGAVEVPEGLQAVADGGVPTAAAVQGAFPDAARNALAQALRAEAGSDTQSRLQLFFKDQLGARSLTPREGDDADAVLSRAEAAVKADDYETALTEIAALPDPAKAAFEDWRALAEARVGALNGFEAVSAALNEN